MDSMSEENELNEDVLSSPAPDNFSMFDMLDGVEYPEAEVTVSLNEKAAYKLGRLAADIKRYQADNDEHDEKVLDEYRSDVEKLRKEIDDSKVTFYLKGVPDEIISGARDIAEARFEEVKKPVKAADGLLRKVLPENEHINYARFLNAVVYSMHVVKVYYHKNGATGGSSPDEMAAFLDRAPDAAKGKLVTEISELRVKAADYEATFDEGFFPKS